MAAGYPKKIAKFMAENPPPPFQVWACNAQAFYLFEYLSTQWHSGLSGRTGLMYSEAYRRLDELGIKDRKERERLIDSLRVMERETLVAQAEASANRQNK